MKITYDWYNYSWHQNLINTNDHKDIEVHRNNMEFHTENNSWIKRQISERKSHKEQKLMD